MRTVEPVRHPEEGSRTIPGALYSSGVSQSMWSGLTQAWALLSYLVSGIVVWGGLGMWLDRVLSLYPVLTISGVLLGHAAGTYLIYLRLSAGERGRGRAA